MANQFTSVATVPGLASELVQPVYDVAVGEALHALPTMRAFVHKTPGNPAMRGSSTTLEKFEWFSDAAVTAAKTPLSEELDVDSTKMPQPSKVTVSPKEYGFAVTSTRKLANRVFAPFDPFKARAIADHQNRVMDSLIQDILIANGTNVSWGGTATSNATLAAGDKLTAAGWKVGATANADKSDIPATVVYYGDPANQAAALGVAQSLPGATIQQSTAFSDTGADITVVIGANYQG